MEARLTLALRKTKTGFPGLRKRTSGRELDKREARLETSYGPPVTGNGSQVAGLFFRIVWKHLPMKLAGFLIPAKNGNTPPIQGAQRETTKNTSTQ